MTHRPPGCAISRAVGMDTGRFLAVICFSLLALNGFMSSSPTTATPCPARCDCQRPRHLMCTNRGLRAVPEPAARVSEEALTVSLGGNFIGNVSAFDFARYGNLVRLNLQYNRIQNIHPKAFEPLVRLEELFLGHNLLSDIPAGTLRPLKKLTILYGNNNNIKTIAPELFDHLDHLVKLRLDGNAIEALQDSVFKSLTGLHYLHLESNRLRRVHQNAFARLTNLRFLNLARNKQSAVRSALTFSPLRALTTLLLSENEIEHVGRHVFQNLRRLSKLSLSNNRISRLDRGALEGLSSLRQLLMDGNALQEIPAGLLDSLVRVEELDLSRNRIATVDPSAFTHLRRLRVLRLRDNMLSSLSGDVFALNNVLYDVDLHGNNWTCDCRLEELKSWMTAAHSRGKLLTVFVQCHQPESLRGKYLDYVNSSQLQPLGNWTQLCRSPVRPEESRGGGVLVKVEGRGTEPVEAVEPLEASMRQEAEGGQVRGPEDTDMRRGDGDEVITRKEGEKGKRGGRGEVRVQGDREEVEVAARSSLEGKKPRRDSLGPRSRLTIGAVSERAKGRRRSNVVSGTDPPPGEPGERTTDLRTALTTTTSPGQTREKFQDALPVITDPCVFNRQFIVDVSADNVTSSTVTVHWTTRDHHRYTPGPGRGLDEVHYRILFDRFGTPDRFPRYVYTRGTARSVTLRELSADATYMVCVEGVVGRAVCQVAPRDHCAGLVTLPGELRRHGGLLTSDLQLVTVATLAGNAALLLVVGCAWLGRSLRRRLQRRKSAVHVRHMYSTRRPFRSAAAMASASTDFTSYQSSRPARLAPLEEGDLIQFPCERFLDNNSVRRDSDMQRFSD